MLGSKCHCALRLKQQIPWLWRGYISCTQRAGRLASQPEQQLHYSNQRAYQGSRNLQAIRRIFIVAAAADPNPVQRRVRHIILPPDKQHLLDTLQDELQGGANFGELAKEHSSCLSAEQGGELGWVKQGMGLPQMLEQAIFDADVDETFTADSKHGVHILQVLEERPIVQLQSMDVTELASILEKGPEAAQFIDVREPGEHAIAQLPHFQLLPLSRMQQWAPTLAQKYDTEKDTICLCHAGMRSRQFGSMLVEQGFKRVFNVSGGIEAYSCLVDNKVPRY